jgi:uncharacterized phage-like protein YoqJ
MKIALTGHRRLNYRYDWPLDQATKIADALRTHLIHLCPPPPDLSDSSATYSYLLDHELITGMALGFDQLGAEVGLSLGLTVHAYLPCSHQDSKWPAHAKLRYHEILDRIAYSGHITMVSPDPYTHRCMQARNEAMVDDADHLIAFWDGLSRGGTFNCIQYAVRQWYPSACQPSMVDIIDSHAPRITRIPLPIHLPQRTI